MPDPVPAPGADPLAVDDRDISPRPWPQLVAAVMELRDCGKPAAESHVNDVGRVQAERELEARWTANGEGPEGE